MSSRFNRTVSYFTISVLLIVIVTSFSSRADTPCPPGHDKKLENPMPPCTTRPVVAPANLCNYGTAQFGNVWKCTDGNGGVVNDDVTVIYNPNWKCAFIPNSSPTTTCVNLVVNMIIPPATTPVPVTIYAPCFDYMPCVASNNGFGIYNCLTTVQRTATVNVLTEVPCVSAPGD